MKLVLKRRALMTGLISLVAALIAGCGGGSSQSGRSTAAPSRPEAIGRTGASAPAAASPTAGDPGNPTGGERAGGRRDGADPARREQKGGKGQSKTRPHGGGTRRDENQSTPAPERGQGGGGHATEADGRRAASHPKPARQHLRAKLAELVGGKGAPAAESTSGGATEPEAGASPEPSGSAESAIIQEVIGAVGASEEPGGGTGSVKGIVEGILGGGR
jgi:hypothetical protein